MNRLIRQIPEGMQDTLPGECRQKRRVEAALRALFARDGFFEVQTPALEYCDAFTGGASGVAPERMYKTFDKQGRVLAVRPDSTTPVMRMVATRMQDAPLPLRLCYVQDVLEYPARPNPRFSQATQAGVELLGESSPEADAEVIALAVRSLLEAGLRSFQIDIGQVGFFKGLMEEAGLSAQETERLRGYVEEKNMLAIELMLGERNVGRRSSAASRACPSSTAAPRCWTRRRPCPKRLHAGRPCRTCATCWRCLRTMGWRSTCP